MSDDLAAARARRDAIRDEIARIERDLAAQSSLRAQRAEVERALRDAEAALERTRKRALPLLSSVRIASPCDERWEDMKGDARARLCGACDHMVYDVRAMHAEEAEALLAAHGESLCLQLYRRADGTLLTADCRVGARRKMRRKLLAATAASLAMTGVAALGRAFLSAPEPPPESPPALASASEPPAICALELRPPEAPKVTILREPPNRPRERLVRGRIRLPRPDVDPSEP